MTRRHGHRDRRDWASGSERPGPCRTARCRCPGSGDRAGRTQRRRQDDAAPPARRPGRAERRHGRGARAGPGRVRGVPGRHRLSGPGRAALPAPERRRPPRARAPISTGAGTPTGPGQRLARLQIPLDRPVATLSGGQRAQVGLGLALAKRPQAAALDEPVAALDPLARREFLASLTEAVADGGLSVILSSHLLHDLERVCDHVILLSASPGPALRRHRRPCWPRTACWSVPGARSSEVEPGLTVITATQTHRQTRLLVRLDGPGARPGLGGAEVGLEDIILAYMGSEQAGLRGPPGRWRWRSEPSSSGASTATRPTSPSPHWPCWRWSSLVTGITMADDYRRVPGQLRRHPELRRRASSSAATGPSSTWST